MQPSPWPSRQPTDRERLENILACAKEALSYSVNKSRDDLDKDPSLVRLLRSCIQDIGEAAAKLSEPARTSVPGIPWGSIVMMRHALVHVYWGVDSDALWNVVTSDLAPLVAAIEASFKDNPGA